MHSFPEYIDDCLPLHNFATRLCAYFTNLNTRNYENETHGKNTKLPDLRTHCIRDNFKQDMTELSKKIQDERSSTALGTEFVINEPAREKESCLILTYIASECTFNGIWQRRKYLMILVPQL